MELNLIIHLGTYTVELCLLIKMSKFSIFPVIEINSITFLVMFQNLLPSFIIILSLQKQGTTKNCYHTEPTMCLFIIGEMADSVW